MGIAPAVPLYKNYHRGAMSEWAQRLVARYENPCPSCGGREVDVRAGECAYCGNRLRMIK